jgi:hypothetical protein
VIRKKRAGVTKSMRPVEVVPAGIRTVRTRCALPEPHVVYDAPDLSKSVQVTVDALQFVVHLRDRSLIPTA